MNLNMPLICHPRFWGLQWGYQDMSGGGAHGVMVIIVGNGHGNTSSNPGRDWLHFT